MTELLAALEASVPGSTQEEADLDRLRALAAAARDGAWDRSTPFHVTASALVVHPSTARVLLRWHERQRAWIHLGGHADPGETAPLVVARREAEEESGLGDLRPWPVGRRPRIVHAVVVPVPANEVEPAHEHGDVRFLLATERPDDACPEHDDAELRWLPVSEAMELTTEENVRELLRRAAEVLGSA